MHACVALIPVRFAAVPMWADLEAAGFMPLAHFMAADSTAAGADSTAAADIAKFGSGDAAGPSTASVLLPAALPEA